MISAEALVSAFGRNANYVHTHLKDLPQADALLQPPVNGNCIHWIVGHIVCYRNYILEALGQTAILPEAKRFARGSAPVLGPEAGLPAFDTLVNAYDQAQDRIAAGIRGLTPEQAVEVISQLEFTMPRAELIMSYMRHESYHAGQLELLREIALAHRK